jgi:hypothetical protein
LNIDLEQFVGLTVREQIQPFAEAGLNPIDVAVSRRERFITTELGHGKIHRVS